MFDRDIVRHLENWSNKSRRKPLILRGARQVGKTTAVDAFSKNFSQYIYLNLETPQDRAPFNEFTDIDKLLQAIFFLKNRTLSDLSDTLLFIDEIQAAPEAVAMLRYFYEQYPALRVIAAGSLLETIFTRDQSFPVGRVEFLVVRPGSFPEFLAAMGETIALEKLKEIPIADFAHSKLLQLFHTYATIGGMPEIISTYAEARDLTALRPIYDQLITAYLDDVEKYGRNNHLLQVIRHCIRVSFTEAGNRIKFQHFGHSNYNSREVGEALRTLEKTFLLSLLYPTVYPQLPIRPDLKKSPRLQVLDTGLMNYFLGIQVETLGTSDLHKMHQGLMIEHLIGQELLAQQFDALSSLNFWVREKSASTAEVDYVYPFEGLLIPVEVKSGKDGTLRSLHLFMEEASHNLAIRFYSGKLQLSKIVTPGGKAVNLLSLPYYLASQLKAYVHWLRDQSKTLPPL